MTETPTLQVIRGTLRRFLARTMQNNWLLLFGLLPLMLWTTLTLIVPVRTIQLEARTISARVTLNGGPQSWNMTNAVVCGPSADLRKEPAPPCGAGQDRLDTPANPVGIVDWASGQELTLIWNPAGLRILMTSKIAHQHSRTELWPPQSELFLTTERVIENGALAFSGRVVIGEQMSAGATNFMLNGSYQIFERGLTGAFFGLSPDITRQGELRRGDEVEVICRDSLWHSCRGQPLNETSGRYANTVSGAISMDLRDAPGMHVIALGEEANSFLKVASAGRAHALEVKPNWLQRAAVSSSLVAISVILALWAPLLLAVMDRYNKP